MFTIHLYVVRVVINSLHYDGLFFFFKQIQVYKMSDETTKHFHILNEHFDINVSLL